MERKTGKYWVQIAEPLLSGNPKTKYPNTRVYFFLGQFDWRPECVETAHKYYKVIKPSSNKSLEYLDGVEHGVHEYQLGAERIVDTILSL
jgi:hypothetical protein